MLRLKPLVICLFAAAATQALADGGTYFQTQIGNDNHLDVDQVDAGGSVIRQTQLQDFNDANAEQASEKSSRIVQHQTGVATTLQGLNIADSVQGMGQGNLANLSPNGMSNTAVTWQITAKLSRAIGSQTGSGNTIDIVQSSTVGTTANLKQTGTFNVAESFQEDQVGSTAIAHQEGSDNEALLEQIDGVNNWGRVSQTGALNVGHIFQTDASHSSANLQQTGDGNTAHTLQTGTGHYLNIRSTNGMAPIATLHSINQTPETTPKTGSWPRSEALRG